MRSVCNRALGVAVLLLSSTWAMAQMPIAFVDMEKLFQGYYKTIRHDAALNKQKELYREHGENLVAEVELLKQQREENKKAALSIALSDDARSRHRRTMEEKDAFFQEKVKEYQSFRRETTEKLQNLYKKSRDEIVGELRKFLRGYCQQQGIELLLDVSGRTLNGIPVLVYHAEAKEVTDTVMAELNQGHEEEVTAAQAARKVEGGGETDDKAKSAGDGGGQ